VQPVFRASNPLIYRSTGLGMSALPTEFAPFPRLGADGWSAASDAVGKSVTFRHKIGTGFQCANRKALIYGRRRGSPVGALGGLHPPHPSGLCTNRGLQPIVAVLQVLLESEQISAFPAEEPYCDGSAYGVSRRDSSTTQSILYAITGRRPSSGILVFRVQPCLRGTECGLSGSGDMAFVESRCSILVVEYR